MGLKALARRILLEWQRRYGNQLDSGAQRGVPPLKRGRSAHATRFPHAAAQSRELEMAAGCDEFTLETDWLASDEHAAV